MSEKKVLLKWRSRCSPPVILAGIRTSAVYVVNVGTLAALSEGGLGDLIVSGLNMFWSDLLLSAPGWAPRWQYFSTAFWELWRRNTPWAILPNSEFSQVGLFKVRLWRPTLYKEVITSEDQGCKSGSKFHHWKLQ